MMQSTVGAVQPTTTSPRRQGSTDLVIRRIGMVGLGHMGHAFAANLVDDGHQVFVYDREPTRMAALTGARAAAHVTDLASCGHCHINELSLPSFLPVPDFGAGQ
jgi:phosphoglycerate dehydrogenase-like enzyme